MTEFNFHTSRAQQEPFAKKDIGMNRKHQMNLFKISGEPSILIKLAYYGSRKFQ